MLLINQHINSNGLALNASFSTSSFGKSGKGNQDFPVIYWVGVLRTSSNPILINL